MLLMPTDLMLSSNWDTSLPCRLCLQLSESFLSSLERLVVVLVDHYPRLKPSSLGPLCHKVILLVLVALAEKGPTLQPFVSHVGQ